MSLKFYLKSLQLFWQDSNFRVKASHEARSWFKHLLPARLVTPRSKYVYCYDVMRYDKGRWLPPGGLHLRPSAYGVAFDEAGNVLMVLDGFWGSRFSLPGGAVEPGETLVQALEREFVEETGLTVKVGEVIDNVDEFLIMPTGQGIHGLLHFYLVDITGGTLLAGGNGFDTSAALYQDIENLPPAKLGGDEKLRRVVQRARVLRKLGNPEI